MPTNFVASQIVHNVFPPIRFHLLCVLFADTLCAENLNDPKSPLGQTRGFNFYSECPAGRADEVQTPAGPLHKGRALMFFIARVGEEEEEEEEVGNSTKQGLAVRGCACLESSLSMHAPL